MIVECIKISINNTHVQNTGIKYNRFTMFTIRLLDTTIKHLNLLLWPWLRSLNVFTLLIYLIDNISPGLSFEVTLQWVFFFSAVFLIFGCLEKKLNKGIMITGPLWTLFPFTTLTRWQGSSLIFFACVILLLAKTWC